MALIQCDFFSDVLGLSCSMNVILPQRTRGQIGMAGAAGAGRHPTLWLLHGMSDDHTTWARRTSIERYAAEKGLAVVMPAVGRSFYTDQKAGYNYWTFISEELPGIARAMFPLSEQPADNFAAGLSMGGYGAFKLALRCPERFAAAASLSGALDAASILQHRPHYEDEVTRTFGELDDLCASDNDLFHLAEQVAGSKGPNPALYFCCGTDDFLREDNVRFREHLQMLDLPHDYEEDPGRAHTWDYWDETIRRVLNWLPLRRSTD